MSPSLAKFIATEEELNEIAKFDDNVASYQFRRDEWLKKVVSKNHNKQYLNNIWMEKDHGYNV